MTLTEQRLADALRAVASSVDEKTLTPLQAPPRPRRHWAIRLAPAFAAAGVALAVVISLLVPSGPGHHPAAGIFPAAGVAQAGVPRYYADISLPNTRFIEIEIRATATSKVTAVVPAARVSGQKYPLVPSSVAAEPGDRTFIAAYSRNGNFPPYATWLYRIQLNNAGRVTGFAQFTYGVVDNLGVLGEMSISPDGSQVAFPTCHLGTSTGPFCEVANEIEVVNLATGTQTLYRGGLPPAKAGLSIKDVSWAPNGHTLVFLALWCHTLLGIQDPVELAPDSTGRYWLMVSGLDRWIGPSGVHRLKPYYKDDLLGW